jgi:copper/silver efflux system protein
MIERIIEFSARRRALVFALTALAALLGWWSVHRTPVDAFPDPGDTQVIVFSTWDRSPDLVEDQVTHPIVTALLGAPKVRTVRGISDFGSSFVYVIFEEGVDPYWARSRTQEYLSQALARLPPGARTQLGPDATGLGWILQYVVTDPGGGHSLDELRAVQDWYLSYHLRSVPGVAEVASVGGFERQFQVNLDPNRLRAFGIAVSRVVEAVRAGNVETGGRLIEFGGGEYMVRGFGYARTVSDIEQIVLSGEESERPVRIRDVGQVALGPQPRRGVTDLDGGGETVSGIVVMRQGANALEVIGRVKERLRQVESGLPSGVRVVPIYDRSGLIRRSIETLRSTVIEVVVTVSLVIFLFLWHIPSALIPVITIPITLLIAFVPLRALGIQADIMSLGGVAIAVGALVDAAIVMVEQTHKRMEEAGRGDPDYDRSAVVLAAIREVGRPAFLSLLVLGISFVPVLALQGEEGRLFRPLAYTKTLCMLAAGLLAITLDPALRVWFARQRVRNFQPRWLCRTVNAMLAGRIRQEGEHPVSRALIRVYTPAVTWSLLHPRLVIACALGAVLVTVPAFYRLGSEFLPEVDEGDLLYMPTTAPGISIGQAQQLLETSGRTLKSFPEVDRVLGKAGRAATATDPAPLSMLETVVTLRPREQWRERETWYSAWAPGWLKPALRPITSDRISRGELVAEMNRALTMTGVSNAWTMPVRGRIDMLATGIRTPVGLKITGRDAAELDRLGARAETILRGVPGTRGAFAERLMGGRYLDIRWDRERLARNGLSMADAQASVESAIGGQDASVTIDGRARYPIGVRYMRDFRYDPEAIGQVLVSSPGGKRQIPLASLAEVGFADGPSMLRNENGMLTGYIYVDVEGGDLGGYVASADRALRTQLTLPAGYSFAWSGQFEAMERTRQALWEIVPLALGAIVLLLWINTRSAARTLLILTAVPFSAVGAVWLLHLLGYQLSVAVWVGLIALLGVDAETGVFMLLYLDLACDAARRAGRLGTPAELRSAIVEGAAKRIRPKFMTAATMLMGLLPILWADGTGAEVMKRIAAPLAGGIVTSFLMELLVYPPVYELWKRHGMVRRSTPGTDIAIGPELTAISA